MSDKLGATDAAELFARAAALLFLIATEYIAFRLLSFISPFFSIYWCGVGIAALWCCLCWLLGGRRLFHDLREIYFYDVLVQIYGLVAVSMGDSPDTFRALANAIVLLKLTRIIWPARVASGTLAPGWPCFGLLGFLARHRVVLGLTQRQILATYAACVCAIPAGFIYYYGLQQYGMVTFFCGILILVIVTTKRNTDVIETTEAALRQKSAELAVADERARVAVERAEQAAQLERLNADLEQANLALADANNRLQSKNDAISRANETLALHDKFVSQANHDIIPLLNFLHIHAEWALKETSSERQGTSIREIISLNSNIADRLACMLGLRRTTIHRQQSIFASVKLSTILEEMEFPFMQIAEKRGSQFALKGDFYLNVWSNEEYLQRIISNLVKNAIIHNPPGTTIHVLVTPGKKNNCLIRVLDTGPGLPEAGGSDWKQNFQDLLARSARDAAAANSSGTASHSDGRHGNGRHGIGLQSVATLCEELGLKIQLYRRGCCGTIFLLRLEMAARGNEVAGA